MTEQEIKSACHKALDDLFMVCKNLDVTGPSMLKIHFTQGKPGDYGFIMEKTSCIRRQEKVR